MEQLNNEVISVFLFIFGTAIGSFLNVLIDRLPREESINGRSHCEHCGKKIAWYDLFPLVSYIFLQGKCRNCKKNIPSVLFFIELLTGVTFVLTYALLGNTLLEKVCYLGIVSSLIVIFFADAKYKIIPDSMHIALLIFSTGLIFQTNNPSLITHIRDGFIILAPILFLYVVTKGKGMGFGDVKLAFVIGYMFGWIGGVIALYIGFITGATVGAYLLLRGKKKLKQTIAFGPFLVIGMLSMLFFQQPLLHIFRSYFPF